MKLVHAAASLARTGIGWSSSVAVVVGGRVVIVGSVVVVRIGRSTIAVPGGGRLGSEAGARPADRRGLSVFRPVRRGAPVPAGAGITQVPPARGGLRPATRS